jgi:hypothetical protein
MAQWNLPPKAKVYEALTAVADGRVRIVEAVAGDAGAGTAGGRAEVASSSGSQTYMVTWTRRPDAGPAETWPAVSAFTSNDNASYWQGYAGYPIIAVLLATGAITYDAEVARRLAGVPWKKINDRFKRDYDRAVEAVLQDVEAAGGDRAAIAAQVDSIHEQLAALRLEKGKRGAPPPKANREL